MLKDYKASILIELTAYQREWSFEALIMAAMRKADTENMSKLRSAFPEIAYELQTRFNLPNGGPERIS